MRDGGTVGGGADFEGWGFDAVALDWGGEVTVFTVYLFFFFLLVYVSVHVCLDRYKQVENNRIDTYPRHKQDDEKGNESLE